MIQYPTLLSPGAGKLGEAAKKGNLVIRLAEKSRDVNSASTKSILRLIPVFFSLTSESADEN